MIHDYVRVINFLLLLIIIKLLFIKVIGWSHTTWNLNNCHHVSLTDVTHASYVITALSVQLLFTRTKKFACKFCSRKC